MHAWLGEPSSLVTTLKDSSSRTLFHHFHIINSKTQQEKEEDVDGDGDIARPGWRNEGRGVKKANIKK